MMGEVSASLNRDGRTIEQSPIAPLDLAALIVRIQDGTISNKAAREVFADLWGRTELQPPAAVSALERVDAVIAAKGLRQVSDAGALDAAVDAVLAANAKSVEEVRAGKEKAFHALVGQVMKATQGKANPAQVNELLRRKLTP
jgi:aspartyl-tRNA(Asn)/glutamyl-tRNA(Gln) amidotransferase subunit B